MDYLQPEPRWALEHEWYPHEVRDQSWVGEGRLAAERAVFWEEGSGGKRLNSSNRGGLYQPEVGIWVWFLQHRLQKSVKIVSVIAVSRTRPFLGTECRHGSGKNPLLQNSSEGLGVSPDSFMRVSQPFFFSAKESLQSQCVILGGWDEWGGAMGIVFRASAACMGSLSTHTCARPAGGSFSVPFLLPIPPIQSSDMCSQFPTRVGTTVWWGHKQGLWGHLKIST